jgi:hypothetical protein
MVREHGPRFPPPAVLGAYVSSVARKQTAEP